ncbi:MAG: S53 family peptidase, partial [Candidatus Eremiobacteraeota bacterium]|nr:S53 family peptidase [Candidatus Eremiobacteraeota bacterium]
MRLSKISAAAAVVALTACTESTTSLPAATSMAGCAASAQRSLSTMPEPNPPAALHPPTAADLGAWPRRGRAARVCGDVGRGFARCQAWLRTDVAGTILPNTPGGYGPSDLQKAYGLTSYSESNSGCTVAIVDAYDDPNAAADLNVYRLHYGLPACTVSDGCFTKQQYAARTDVGWAGEESLDVDMVSAICPKCRILLVEAASANVADLDAAERFATSHAQYVSNSWSGDEGTTSYDADFNVRGVAVTAATGDKAYSVNAQWPAILPSVIAVGGTALISVNPLAETAWASAGSGCSKLYAKPSFQANLNTGCSMRAEADVSADADPDTGVAVYDTFHHSGWHVFGGTSAAAPIVASVFALAGKTDANDPGNLYAHAPALFNVTSGSNGVCGKPLCVAGSGWNGPTGLG